MIESTPTFELPNQFLVWIAQKVLALCYLDLLLIEYYKERLEPRLKNIKERDTTVHMSTLLMRLTRLQLSTNWTSYKNFLLANLFLLSLPSSCLSLLSLVNLPKLLMSYYKPFCLNLGYDLNLFSCSFLVTSTSIGKIEQL